MTAGSLEDKHVILVESIRAKVKIPIAVKLQPILYSPSHTLQNAFAQTGADGLVLFNRFYQPDFDSG